MYIYFTRVTKFITNISIKINRHDCDKNNENDIAIFFNGEINYINKEMII